MPNSKPTAANIQSFGCKNGTITFSLPELNQILKITRSGHQLHCSLTNQENGERNLPANTQDTQLTEKWHQITETSTYVLYGRKIGQTIDVKFEKTC